jgi:uncharacterized protein (TIGR02246 family)
LNQQSAIAALFEEWARAIERKDVDALLDLIAADAEFWTHGAAALRGRGAIRAAFESLFSRFEMRQDFECLELVVGEDLAFARGLEHNHLHPLDGGEDLVRTQRAFSVLFKDPANRWRFARGMTNLPPQS